MVWNLVLPFHATHTVSHEFWELLGTRLVDPWVRFYPKLLCLSLEKRVIFGCIRVVVGAKIFVTSDVGLWFSMTRAFQEFVQQTSSPLPSLLRCEVRNKLFASLCFRDVHRKMVRSLSRSSELVKHHTDLCLIFDFCLKVGSMFRKYSIQCLSSSMLNSCGTVLWKWSRTSRSTPCFPCSGSCPSTSRWMGWTLHPFPGRLSTLGDLYVFQIDESTFLTASLRVPSCCWTLGCGNPRILKSMLPQRERE